MKPITQNIIDGYRQALIEQADNLFRLKSRKGESDIRYLQQLLELSNEILINTGQFKEILENELG